MANTKEFIDFIFSPAFTLADHREVIAALNELAKQRQRRAASQFHVGSRVMWDSTRTGRPIHGRVTKINRKNIDVTDDVGNRWRVSPSLLRPSVQPDRI